jgi:hypothetical protein
MRLGAPDPAAGAVFGTPPRRRAAAHVRAGERRKLPPTQLRSGCVVQPEHSGLLDDIWQAWAWFESKRI